MLGVDTHAFLYSGGSTQDLGALGGKHSIAYSINSSGQVVGFADTKQGVEHGFLYTNVVNIVDLSTVARELPPGTTCK